MNIKKAIETTFNHEGLYSNDPDDPGKETYKGISRRYWPGWKGWEIIDRMKEKVNFPENLKGHARLDSLVESFYQKNIWKEKYDLLPTYLQPMFFDMIINPGESGAVEILQRACNGSGKNIVVDKKFGPITANASQVVKPLRLTAYRILYYAERIHEDPSKEKYWYGWFRRSISFLEDSNE